MTAETALHLENQLCFPLYVASRLVIKQYAPLLAELDLTYPQYLVMLVLWQTDGLPVNTLAETLYLETNTVTPLLKRLEQKGLLHRRRSVEDERKVIVSLSDTGTVLRERAVCIPGQIMDSVRSESLSAAEVQAFKRTLTTVIEALG